MIHSLALVVLPILPTPQSGRQPAAEPAPPAAVQEHASPTLRARVEQSFDPHGLGDETGLPKGTSIFPNPYPELAQGFESISSSPTSLSAGGPANASCVNATIIPSNSLHYAIQQSTVGGLNELCEPFASCEAGGVGTSASVWFEYIPDRDGRVTIDTLGSNYNTVLSVYDGCGSFSPFGCIEPEELACNDDYFFGTTSQVNLDVTGGETYLISAAAYGSGSGGLLDFDLFFYPANELCDNATEIVGVAFRDELVPTQNADIETCEPNESCEFNGVGTSNSVWYSFLAPCDGTLDLNTNESTYDTVLSVWDGCGVFNGIDAQCDIPTEIACDDDAGVGTNSQLIGVPVVGGEEYRIKVADYNTTSGGGYLTFNALFRPASPPVAEIDSPANFGCICPGVQVIEGTADAGAEGLAEWKLEYEPTTGGPRIPLATSTQAVTNGPLANWNTAGLASGHYLLHLTVTAACGATSTSTRVVYLDAAYDLAELHAPANNSILGGIVCIDGTAWDSCFEKYTLEVAPSGTQAFSQIGGESETRINESLLDGGWDTTSVPDGQYDLRLVAEDECGHTGVVVRTITIDNTAPVALLTSPDACTSQYGLVSIEGIASDTNLTQWSLQHSDPNGPGWVTIATGASNASGLLASLDMASLPRCAYTLRLLVVDASIRNCDDPVLSEYTLSISNLFPPGRKQIATKHP